MWLKGFPMSGSAKLSAGIIAAAVLSLAACGVSFTNEPDMIDKDLLSAQVQAQLTKERSEQAPTIDCPADLKPVVGATTTCLMKAPRGTYNVTVAITKLQPGEAGNYNTGNAIFDAKVADQPNP